MSFEPHLGFDHHHQSSDPKSFDNLNSASYDAANLLAELDRIAPIKRFDAFPKVQSTYTERSKRGGILTAIVGTIIFLLVLNDLGEYLFSAPSFSFHVDPYVDTKDLQLNVDLTVAMGCHYLSIDLRDVVGDRLHLSDSFVKDGTEFGLGKAVSSQPIEPTSPSAQKVIHDARRGTRNPLTLPKSSRRTSASSGIRALFSRLIHHPIKSHSSQPDARHTPQGKHIAGFRKTEKLMPGSGPGAGPACRIYGSVGVKRVTGNLHITTLGHGYMSWEHTGHEKMNLSHVIHEFSFGPFFPAIAQPLDLTYTTTDAPFAIFQYFLSVVPTTYIDSRKRKVQTSQYAVTDYSRAIEHGRGVPGIFFKFDLEPLSMTVEERTTTLYQFLIRLAGVVGGVWTTAAFALRVLTRAEKEVKTKVLKTEKAYSPAVLPTPGGNSPGPGGNGYNGDGMMKRSNSYFGSNPAGYNGSVYT